MSSVLSTHVQLVLRMGVFGALAGVFGFACCKPVEYVYPKNLQGFSLPSGCPSGAAPTDTTQLKSCLRGIEFDTTEFVGDEQRLMVRADSGSGPGAPCFGDSAHVCRHGPLARVDPVIGSELYSDSAMAEGRIIARIYLRQGETESYPKFALVPVDTTYWWVRASGPDSVSVFFHRDSTQSDLADTTRGLHMNAHPRGSFQQAFAQWVWDPTDETLNGSCAGHCCKP
jgi:hypothetical protein